MKDSYNDYYVRSENPQSYTDWVIKHEINPQIIRCVILICAIVTGVAVLAWLQ